MEFEQQKMFSFLIENTQTFFAVSCSPKSVGTNFSPPPKREGKKSSQFSTKAIFSHEGMSTVVNYRISVSGPFQYTAPTRAPE